MPASPGCCVSPAPGASVCSMALSGTLPGAALPVPPWPALAGVASAAGGGVGGLASPPCLPSCAALSSPPCPSRSRRSCFSSTPGATLLRGQAGCSMPPPRSAAGSFGCLSKRVPPGLSGSAPHNHVPRCTDRGARTDLPATRTPTHPRGCPHCFARCSTHQLPRTPAQVTGVRHERLSVGVQHLVRIAAAPPPAPSLAATALLLARGLACALGHPASMRGGVFSAGLSCTSRGNPQELRCWAGLFPPLLSVLLAGLGAGSTMQPPSTRPHATPADSHAPDTLGLVSQGWLAQGCTLRLV
jgi:hypothetical protein